MLQINPNAAAWPLPRVNLHPSIDVAFSKWVQSRASDTVAGIPFGGAVAESKGHPNGGISCRLMSHGVAGRIAAYNGKHLKRLGKR